MQVTRRVYSIILKLLIAFLAGIGAWSEFNTWGAQAWRLFDTYIMLAATFYYLVSAGFLLFNPRRQPNEVIMPSIVALLTVNCLLLMTSAITFNLSDTTFPITDGFSSIIICGIVPVLVIVDWLFFCQKGHLRPIDPFYWLAPAIVYSCLIVTTASMMPNMAILRLPYEIINYPEIGVDTMVLWGIITMTLMLITGYVIYCLDFALSGSLSKHIVMPKLKPVVIDLPKDLPRDKTSTPAITLASSAATKNANKVPAPKPIVAPVAKKTSEKPSAKKSSTQQKSIKNKSQANVQPTTKPTPKENPDNNPKTNAKNSPITKNPSKNNSAISKEVKQTGKANNPTKPAKFHKPASIQNAPSNTKKINTKTPVTKDAPTPAEKSADLNHSSEFRVPKAITEPRKGTKNEKKDTKQNSESHSNTEPKTNSRKDQFELPRLSSRQNADAPRPSKSLKPVEAIKELQEKPLDQPKPIKLAEKPQPTANDTAKPRPKITKF